MFWKILILALYPIPNCNQTSIEKKRHTHPTIRAVESVVKSYICRKKMKFSFRCSVCLQYFFAYVCARLDDFFSALSVNLHSGSMLGATCRIPARRRINRRALHVHPERNRGHICMRAIFIRNHWTQRLHFLFPDNTPNNKLQIVRRQYRAKIS